MKRAEKAKKIGEILDRLYPQPDIPLGHRDPFTRRRPRSRECRNTKS